MECAVYQCAKKTGRGLNEKCIGAHGKRVKRYLIRCLPYRECRDMKMKL
jgi:hypothetical protein